MTTQLSLPVVVNFDEVARKKSLGAAIELCMEIGELPLDKSARAALLAERGMVVDKGQFSRWKDGTEGIMWDKFEALMDVCGNDAPLLWMNYQRGWDLHAMRKRQTELEKKLQAAEEKMAQMERDYRLKIEAIRDVRAA